MPLLPGDKRFAGYPSAFVYTATRNKEKKLRKSIAKHLLWGDWVEVRDYDFVDSGDGAKLDPPLTPAEEATARGFFTGMVPVRCRGVNGYMDEADLIEAQLLEVVFVDVGQGDGALLVTPDDRKYVVDAGQRDHMHRYLSWRFAGFKGAHQDLDGLIITHPDADHYQGFDKLIDDDALEAGTIWHNGIMEQFLVKADGSQSGAAADRLGKRATDQGQSYLTDLVVSDADLGAFLAEPKRWTKQSGNRVSVRQYPAMLAKAHVATVGPNAPNAGARRFPDIRMLSTEHGQREGGRTYLPGHGPSDHQGAGPACTIEILGPFVEAKNGTPRLRTFSKTPVEKTGSIDAGKTKNGHSVLMRLQYGKFSLLFGGDLNPPAETFLMGRYTGLDMYGAGKAADEDVRVAARPIFGADVVKACHHGSADFTELFLDVLEPAATVISSGDEESHAHPRSDTLGALGFYGRVARAPIFSTELVRSTKEFTEREDTPWFQSAVLTGKAAETDDPVEKERLEIEARKLMEQERKRNVTVYGSVNLRSDGEKAVLAYMLERPSAGRRWDIYTLEAEPGDARLLPIDRKEAEKREEARREAAANG